MLNRSPTREALKTKSFRRAAACVLLVVLFGPAPDAAVIQAAPPRGDKAATPADLNQAAPARRSRRRPVVTRYEAIDVKDGGSIAGVVRFIGTLPPPRTIEIVKDQAHCGRRPTREPLILADSNGRVAEAVVYLADITRGKAFPSAPAAPRIDQNLCTYKPHVQAVRCKQPVDVLNSDPVAHNINASQGVYTLFNILQPSQGMRSSRTFDRPGLVDLKCNVHDWMHAYVHVFAHPYYQVTGPDGAFALDQVPPGSYELVVWQEYLGEQSYAVKVQAGASPRLDVELKPRTGD